jgi:hypothetical protein
MASKKNEIRDDDLEEWEEELKHLFYPGNTPHETATILLKGKGKIETGSMCCPNIKEKALKRALSNGLSRRSEHTPPLSG